MRSSPSSMRPIQQTYELLQTTPLQPYLIDLVTPEALEVGDHGFLLLLIQLVFKTGHGSSELGTSVLDREHQSIQGMMPSVGTAIERRWRIFPIGQRIVPLRCSLRPFSVADGAAPCKHRLATVYL